MKLPESNIPAKQMKLPENGNIPAKQMKLPENGNIPAKQMKLPENGNIPAKQMKLPENGNIPAKQMKLPENGNIPANLCQLYAETKQMTLLENGSIPANPCQRYVEACRGGGKRNPSQVDKSSKKAESLPLQKCHSAPTSEGKSRTKRASKGMGFASRKRKSQLSKTQDCQPSVKTSVQVEQQDHRTEQLEDVESLSQSHIYATFLEAAQARGLFHSDVLWRQALDQARGRTCKHFVFLFAQVLIEAGELIEDQLQLWNDYKIHMMMPTFHRPNMPDAEIRERQERRALELLSYYISNMGGKYESFNLPPLDGAYDPDVHGEDVDLFVGEFETTERPPEPPKPKVVLGDDQQYAFDTITKAMELGLKNKAMPHRQFFIHGAGGTGKTTLVKNRSRNHFHFLKYDSARPEAEPSRPQQRWTLYFLCETEPREGNSFAFTQVRISRESGEREREIPLLLRKFRNARKSGERETGREDRGRKRNAPF
uniref:DNA helicase n=1 Tax=Bursaphelenchus xylophilus TaxID=6326 RepID=A0A1I7RXS4_BURXY